MKRFMTLVMLLAFSVASALLVRDFLTGSDLDGVTLLPFGVASLNFQYTINTGVNFGLIQEASTTRQLILSGAALLICIAVIIWGYRSRHKWATGAAGLFAGGGLANVYERLTFGGVFDYLNFTTSFFYNPFSFNLADIYIFVGLILFLLAPREARETADGPTRPSSLGPISKFAGNSGLTLSLLVSCLYISWQILSQVNFLYDQIYDWNNLETHVNEFAPLNRNNKQSFALTTKSERVRIFSEIAGEVNSGGSSLDSISYAPSDTSGATKFLIEAERDHLQDVANLLSVLKPLGAIITFLLLSFYGFCWYYKVSRYRYFWRPPGIIVSVLQIFAVAIFCLASTLTLGPQQTFYLLHDLAFSDKAQWFFYFQDSLMTTLMPEIVFANIAVMIGVLTFVIWLIINFLIRRVLV